MTHEKNQGPDDLNWMDIAREDAINDVRHRGSRLPYLAAIVSLVIIGGGAVFAQTSNEPAAQADVSSIVASTPTPALTADVLAPTPSVGTNGVPVIPNVPSVAGKYGDDDDEYEDDDDHRGGRDRHEGDDDDDDDDDDEHEEDDD